jgi:hypothetical protein
MRERYDRTPDQRLLSLPPRKPAPFQPRSRSAAGWRGDG